MLFLEPCNVSIYGLIENHMVEDGYRVWGLCNVVERDKGVEFIVVGCEI